MTNGKSSTIARARRLRRAQSDAENRLWRRLQSRQLGGVKFRRQQPIGPFIVDFCWVEPKLVVEVDGGQHAERAHEDAQRTAFLQRSGYRVIRFWNHEVLQHTDAVVERIAQEVTRTRRSAGAGDAVEEG